MADFVPIQLNSTTPAQHTTKRPLPHSATPPPPAAEPGSPDSIHFVEHIRTELGFLTSSYSPEKLNVQDIVFVRRLQLQHDDDKETIGVELTLTLPEGYPVNAPLPASGSRSRLEQF